MSKKVPGQIVGQETIDRMDAAVKLAAQGMEDDRFRQEHRIEDLVRDLTQVNAESLLVGFRHPVHAYKNWTLLARLVDTLKFVDETIDEERGDGLDLSICTEDFEHLWITSHDGEAYRLK